MHDDIYQMYLEEIEAIRPCTKEEQDQLLKKIAQGDDSARERLVEGSLGQLVELAKEYDGQGVLMGDLIQEANMALLTALAEMTGAGDGDCKVPADFEAFLNASIRPALDAIVEEQKDEKEVGEELAARVNVLQTVSQVLLKELGREATLSELAEKMKMTEDEIRDIMKLALDAVNVSQMPAMTEDEAEDENENM
ncbi:sigma-70 domain-containing protein [Brotaphodocola sp.]|uniref:sigma-70 domain-containing protein n=1 Tax=Brotaphodocola sp. TaxID=3073577 RepID=UPI003D7CB8B5